MCKNQPYFQVKTPWKHLYFDIFCIICLEKKTLRIPMSFWGWELCFGPLRLQRSHASSQVGLTHFPWEFPVSILGVEPKIGGKPPKWMVYNMHPWMIWGENQLFSETSISNKDIAWMYEPHLWCFWVSMKVVTLLGTTISPRYLWTFSFSTGRMC